MAKKLVQLNLRIPGSVKARLRKLARATKPRGLTMTGKLIELIEKEPTE